MASSRGSDDNAGNSLVNPRWQPRAAVYLPSSVRWKGTLIMTTHETIAQTAILRDDAGYYGANVVAYDGGFSSFTVPCEFATVEALHVRIASMISDELRTRKRLHVGPTDV